MSSAPASVAQATADAERARAIELRNRGDFPAAIVVLRAVTAATARVEDELLLAETLAWNKEFKDSARVYRAILERPNPPASARLGLAQVLLWSRDYAAARRLFRTIDSPQAREGAATAAYWQGDFRTALREFRSVLAADATREFARKSIAEIQSTLTASQRIESTVTRDDQPFEATLARVAATDFIDPLTKWSASAGTWRLYRPDDQRVTHAPRITAGIEHTFPWRRLAVSATAGAVRLPGAGTEPIGDITITKRLGRSALAASVGQREILTNPAERYATVRNAALEWRWETDAGRSAVAHAETRSYSDDNRGVLAYAYAIEPIIRREAFRIWAGASASHADSDEPRFFATSVSSTLSPNGAFAYTYRGLYLPYWSPLDLTEARLIVGGELRWRGNSSFKLQVDGGRTQDKGVAFGPESGFDPLPPTVFPFTFDRIYEPFRLRADANVPLIAALTLQVGYEYSRTIDYEARTFHAAVVRRR